MSKAISNLRKMEKRAYGEWWLAVRYCAESRNAHLTAEPREVPESKARLEMATIAADRAFRLWQQVCEALDEVELNNHHENPRS